MGDDNAACDPTHPASTESIFRAEEIATRMVSISTALSDGTYWVNKDGQKISIRKIDKRYANNLVRWLEDRRKGLHETACILFLALPEPTGEQAGYAYEEEFSRLNEEEPAEWLNRQPLYKHLKLIAEGKELVMSEKQKFTFRISTPATGEVKETWVDASSKIEAAQKFLRRKYVAEWFVEDEHPMKMDVLSEVEIEQEKQAEAVAAP